MLVPDSSCVSISLGTAARTRASIASATGLPNMTTGVTTVGVIGSLLVPRPPEFDRANSAPLRLRNAALGGRFLPSWPARGAHCAQLHHQLEGFDDGFWTPEMGVEGPIESDTRNGSQCAFPVASALGPRPVVPGHRRLWGNTTTSLLHTCSAGFLTRVAL